MSTFRIIAIILLLLFDYINPKKELVITNMTFTPLEIESNDIDELERSAGILFTEGIIREAIPFYEKLISMNGENVHYCSRLATCLFDIEDYETSLEYALKALKLMNWKSTDDDVSGYEYEVRESLLKVAQILLLTDLYDPERSLPYWDAVEYYFDKKEEHEQRDIELHLMVTYYHAMAYYNAGNETRCDEILDLIYDSEQYEQLYNDWCLTHNTTDLGNDPYELYELLCGIE